MGLVARFGLPVPPPPVISIVGAGQRRTVIEGGRTVERLTPQQNYGDTAVADLKFAIRHEPADLRILHAAFRAMDAEDLEAWIRSELTGAFSRRGWFLYEYLLGRTLDVPDAGAVASAPALDPEKHIVIPGEVSRRQQSAWHAGSLPGRAPHPTPDELHGNADRR